jgi:hypothetical protein
MAARGTAGISATRWLPAGELEVREWLEYGRRFGMLGRNVAWWIGDWLVYGNARYGERYAHAARTTGYDTQSLMNMVYVASRFTFERRRGALSWSHHAEVAALEPGEQERWLDLAEEERMSVRSLRTELQAMRRAGRRAERALTAFAGAGESATRVVCPRCRNVIDIERTAGRGTTSPARPVA